MNSNQIKIHKEEDFQKMRESGRIAAMTLDYITEYVKEGVSTNELNDLCHKFIIDQGAIPAPLNYKGFPKSICTSVNHVICHGIPSDRKLKKGDIINIDVTVIVDSWHGDTSRMYFVGEEKDIPLKARKLCMVTYKALEKAINICMPGRRFSDIGREIEAYVKQFNYGIVRDYSGHGIGQKFHDEPSILHYDYGYKNQGPIMKEGMFFTIEPMINIGKPDTILSRIDNWTVTTRDKTLSAQFEHTIAITKDGAEIFTKSPKGLDHPPYI